MEGVNHLHLPCGDRVRLRLFRGGGCEGRLCMARVHHRPRPCGTSSQTNRRTSIRHRSSSDPSCIPSLAHAAERARAAETDVK